jgi:hypothetical protein
VEDRAIVSALLDALHLRTPAFTRVASAGGSGAATASGRLDTSTLDVSAVSRALDLR